MSRVDEEGQELEDLTNAVLGLATRDLGAPVPLEPGLVFQESRSFNAKVVAENGVEIPSIDVTVGLVSRSLTSTQSDSPQFPADVLLGDNFAGIAIIASPRLDQAHYNLDLNDMFSLDLTGLGLVTVGDFVAFEHLFAQALEREAPLSYNGISGPMLFVDRWNRGDFQLLARPSEDGRVLIPVYVSSAVIEGDDPLVSAGAAARADVADGVAIPAQASGRMSARTIAKRNVVSERAVEGGGAAFFATLFGVVFIEVEVFIAVLIVVAATVSGAALGSHVGATDVKLENLPPPEPPPGPPTKLTRGEATSCFVEFVTASLNATVCETVASVPTPPAPPVPTITPKVPLGVPEPVQTLRELGLDIDPELDFPAAPEPSPDPPPPSEPTVTGPHWALIATEPNFPNADLRFDVDTEIRPDLEGTFTSCNPTPGAITIQSVFKQNDTVLHDITFAWTFAQPPAVFLPDVPIPPLPEDPEKKLITGKASGVILTVPNPSSIFRFAISFPAFPDGPDMPVFQSFNEFPGDFIFLEGFPNVSEGPSTVTGTQTRAVGTSVAGNQIRIRAQASGHTAGICSVDWLYEFRDG